MAEKRMTGVAEMDKLESYLRSQGYVYTRTDEDTGSDFDIHQIKVFSPDCRKRELSVICHRGSYGYREGLLEIFGSRITGTSDVLGWLMAEEVIEMLEKAGVGHAPSSDCKVTDCPWK